MSATYYLFIYRTPGPTTRHETVERFTTLAGALRRAAEICPTRPERPNTLRWLSESDGAGGVVQMTSYIGGIANLCDDKSWMPLYFRVPADLQAFLIQRDDVARGSELERRAEGNPPSELNIAPSP